MRRKVWRFGIHRRSIADMLMLVRSVVSRLVCRCCGRAVLELEKLILRHQLHLATSSREAAKHGLAVELKQASSSSLPLPGESVDMVFCHQTFHHQPLAVASRRQASPAPHHKSTAEIRKIDSNGPRVPSKRIA
ncbi:class I SAM-dependent methyltransferase [Candidatus Binatus sp.]|uniref:class I SAM-dependent methyltransferase n=1 Tax=Candidatus Binatus sp. TaxID=2811406 RepID=UPI003C767777